MNQTEAKMGKLEAQIGKLEGQMSQLEAQMGQPSGNLTDHFERMFSVATKTNELLRTNYFWLTDSRLMELMEFSDKSF